jgi:hypothetical protein
MKLTVIRIITLNKKLLHVSHYGCISPRVFFTKDLQQYRVYNGFHNLFLTLDKAWEQSKTIVHLDLRITLSQMLVWTQTLPDIKDHSNTSGETMNAYGADYKKRCAI